MRQECNFETAPLPHSTLRSLDAADGWLMLGDPREALLELDEIEPDLREDPWVLAMTWKIFDAAGKPAEAWVAARLLCELTPDCAAAWICQASSLRQIRGPQAAADLLLCVLDLFSSDAIMPYNAACYLAQVSDWERACYWLLQAFDREEGRYLKKLALLDPDLKPLWEKIGENFAITITAPGN